MNQDLPQHILTIEALEDVVIFCKDEQNKTGWIKINKGLTKRCLEFFGFHPDCLPDSDVKVVSHLNHDVIPFFDGDKYELSNLPEEFRRLVRVSSKKQ